MNIRSDAAVARASRRHGEPGNRLLEALSPEEFGALAPHLEAILVGSGDQLVGIDRPVDHLYFPNGGLASVTTPPTPRKIEVGLIGREGIVGLPVILGVDRTPLDVFAQIPGEFLRVATAPLVEAMARHPRIRMLFLRYAQIFLLQTSYTAMANACLTVEGRLARWLLMCQDRIGRDDLALTHGFLATMLGVRRPGVTVATHVLEGNGVIRAKRGHIRILDRAKLRAAAGGAYGVAEAEYERLIASAATVPEGGGSALIDAAMFDLMQEGAATL